MKLYNTLCSGARFLTRHTNIICSLISSQQRLPQHKRYLIYTVDPLGTWL